MVKHLCRVGAGVKQLFAKNRSGKVSTDWGWGANTQTWKSGAKSQGMGTQSRQTFWHRVSKFPGALRQDSESNGHGLRWPMETALDGLTKTKISIEFFEWKRP